MHGWTEGGQTVRKWRERDRKQKDGTGKGDRKADMLNQISQFELVNCGEYSIEVGHFPIESTY